MSHSPLDQFKVKKLIELTYNNIDISITNSSFMMFIAVSMIAIYFIFALKDRAIIPGRLQMSAEMLHNMIYNSLYQNAGKKSLKYLPLIFTIFMFVLLCNLLGMIPYSFTVTSHISVTFFLAGCLFLFITVIGFIKHGSKFLSLFLPHGTPFWLAPLMIIIELFAYLARPISLSLRLTANMIAGHVLLKVMAGFGISLAIYLKILPIIFITILIGFEIFVAILQAYIFTILTCVYFNDAINLH